MLSPERLAEELTVNSLGELYWVKPGHGRTLYKPVGGLEIRGYLKLRVFYQSYMAHRIVWCLTRGRWPVKDLDHINAIKTDNRPENLREVTPRQNSRGKWTSTRKNKSSSGVRGVSWIEKAQKWQATIHDKAKNINLGLFSDLQDAIDCRRRAEKRLGYTQD